MYGAVLYCGSTGRKPVRGLYLNTPPKPKQARTVELQEAEELELEVDSSLEEETEVKVEKGSREQEAATEWRPGSPRVAELLGAHGDWSGTSRGSHGAETA